MFMKTYKIIRNNWKKSVFFSCVAIWGTNYANNKIKENNIMRAYCEEAFRFGNNYLRADQKARHITVILNPTANKRKSKDKYEKYCAPLFHLAGLRVSLVLTEAEGQAKDLMEVMDNTDAVVIAGGNGTVHEVITGLLRRNDESIAVQKFPIGILPVGKRNTIAYELNKFGRDMNQAEVLAQSTMSVIREILKPIDVMKISGNRGNPVFSLDSLSFGSIRDTIINVDKYWYLGNKLKPYLAFFSNSFRSLSSNNDIIISYSEPCSGCSKCYERFDRQIINDKISVETSRWWHSFLSRNLTSNKQSNQSPKVDLRSVINHNCDQWKKVAVNAANVLVKNTNECKLQIIIHSQPLTQNQFISDGVKLFNCEPMPQTTGSVEVIEAKDINIELPNHTSDVNGDDDGKDDKITDKMTNSWFSIDTESYESQTVNIILIPKKLNMYVK